MIPSREYVDWLLETAQWLVDHGMTVSVDEGAVIVLPTEEDFPVDTTLSGHDLAEDYFAFIREHTNLTDWSFQLVADDPPSPGAVLEGMPHHMIEAPVPIDDIGDEPIPSGEALPVIYTPDLLRTPDRLIAVLALGVAHYYAQTPRPPPPGGEEMFEAAVDVTAIFLGLGVFTANAAFQGQAFERGTLIGYGYSRLGTLGPLEISYALGLRIALIGADFDEIAPHLAPNPRAWVADAIEDLSAHHSARLSALRTPRRQPLGPYRR